MSARSRSVLRRAGSPRRLPAGHHVELYPSVVRLATNMETNPDTRPIKPGNTSFGSSLYPSSWWSTRTPYDKSAKFYGTIPASELWGPKPTAADLAERAAEGLGPDLNARRTRGKTIRNYAGLWQEPGEPVELEKGVWSSCYKGLCYAGATAAGAAAAAYLAYLAANPTYGGSRKRAAKRRRTRKA